MQKTSSSPFLPQYTLYQRWLREKRDLQFDSYDALWQSSTTDLDGFWQSIWDYFDLRSSKPYSAVCDRSASGRMIDVTWFTGATFKVIVAFLNHARPAHRKSRQQRRDDESGVFRIVCGVCGG